MRIARILTIRRLLVALVLLPATTWAQEPPSASIHWAYSSYFGTGWYRVFADRDVFVARMTARWTRSEASLEESGDRKAGLEFRAPISVGLDSFSYDDPLGAVDVDNVSFLSVSPGIDVEIPINDIWSLRPYASIGYGGAFDGSESAWTYWAGVKSRVSLGSGKFNWRLLNQFGFVGFTPRAGPGEKMWPVMAGVEFDHPVGNPTPEGDQLLLHWRASYTLFGEDLDFGGGLSVVQAIQDQWEIGVAIARGKSRIPLWFLKFDMLGLGYRVSSNGELKGITLLYRSMFDL